LMDFINIGVTVSAGEHSRTLHVGAHQNAI